MAFPESKRTFWLWFAVGGAVLLAALLLLGGMAGGAAWVLAAAAAVALLGIWLAVCYFIAMAGERRRMMELAFYLEAECRPDKAVEVYRRLLAGRQRETVRTNLLLGLSAALTYAGQPEEALRLLAELPDAPDSLHGASVHFVKEYRLFGCYSQAGNIEMAEKCIANMRNVLNGPILSSPGVGAARDQYSDRLLTAVYTHRLDTGALAGTELYFQSLFDAAPSRLEKVFAQFRLACIFDQMGDAARTRAALDYVRQNGGSTWLAAQAAAALAAPEA